MSNQQKQQIVNSAFAKGVAQNIAMIFVEYPHVPQIEVYNGFMTLLKHETDGYHKELLMLKHKEKTTIEVAK